ncbi:MAG: Lrp/AsnC ligand binding domain-containing protein [Promethearchaeota archaeon]
MARGTLIYNTKVLILFTFFSNILFGIIPIFVVPLLNQYPESYFMIVFIRFLFSGLSILFIVIVQVFLKHAREKWGKTSRHHKFFQTSWKDLKFYLFSKNKLFYSKNRVLYLFVLGFFGVTLNVVTYLIGLRELSINLMLIGAPGGIIILVSIYNVIKGVERIGLFKALYLFLMLLSLILVIIATQGVTSTSASIPGVIALLLNLLSLFILFIYMERDSYAREEEIWKKDKNGNYRFMRTLLKLSLFMIFGAISVFLIIPLGFLMPASYFHHVSVVFIDNFKIFWELALDPNMLMLVFSCTLMAFLFLFIPATFWDTEQSLSLDQWNSIMYLLDPIIGSTATTLLGYEKIDITLLVITLVILAVAILLRFVHERESKLNAIIYIDIINGRQKQVLSYLSEMHNIRKYYLITGQADFMIKATFGSFSEYHQFIAKLGLNKDIKIRYNLISFINKIIT